MAEGGRKGKDNEVMIQMGDFDSYSRFIGGVERVDGEWDGGGGINSGKDER